MQLNYAIIVSWHLECLVLAALTIPILHGTDGWVLLKMAYIIENIAWNRVTGIGIDTHMHRMFNELRWVKSKNPQQTRTQLEAWLPREKWRTVNKLWVGFGQEVQQFKPKLLRKALTCSRPNDALRLIKKLGLDYVKEGAKLNLTDEIRQALKK